MCNRRGDAAQYREKIDPDAPEFSCMTQERRQALALSNL
jgi:hypothetical protein